MGLAREAYLLVYRTARCMIISLTSAPLSTLESMSINSVTVRESRPAPRCWGPIAAAVPHLLTRARGPPLLERLPSTIAKH